MDRAGQEAGARQVREALIAPLLRMGLGKPAGLKKAEFDAMLEEVCQRLAYMSPVNLAALVEVVAANPAGKDKNRFPIATRVLYLAAQIQAPGDDASPLLRAVFSQALGQQAIAEGWAPELLADLRKMRRWPSSFVITQLRSDAAGSVRKLEALDRITAAGDTLTDDEAVFVTTRRAALEKCRRIAAVAAGERA